MWECSCLQLMQWVLVPSSQIGYSLGKSGFQIHQFSSWNLQAAKAVMMETICCWRYLVDFFDMFFISFFLHAYFFKCLTAITSSTLLEKLSKKFRFMVVESFHCCSRRVSVRSCTDVGCDSLTCNSTPMVFYQMEVRALFIFHLTHLARPCVYGPYFVHWCTVMHPQTIIA